VHGDLLNCQIHCRTSDSQRTLPALQDAWDQEGASEAYSESTSIRWIEKFVTLTDNDRLTTDSHPNACAMLQTRLRGSGIPHTEYGPQLGYDNEPYDAIREAKRLIHFEAWKSWGDELKTADHARAPGVAKFLIDWNTSRCCSCVKDTVGFQPHEAQRHHELGVGSPHPDTLLADRVVTGTLTLDMGNGEKLILYNVAQCSSFSDNVIVAMHVNGTTNWSATPRGLISPMGTTFQLEAFQKRDAIGIIFDQRQSLLVRSLTIKPGTPVPSTPAPADFQNYHEAGVDLCHTPLSTSNLPGVIQRSSFLSDSRGKEVAIFLKHQSPGGCANLVVNPGWMEHPSSTETPANDPRAIRLIDRAVGPADTSPRRFPLEPPPLRPSLTAIREREARGIAPDSVRVRHQMTASVPVVQTDADALHWRLEIAVRPGTTEGVAAVTSGACGHNFMNGNWALRHGLVISRAPVFKRFLQDEIDDHSDTVFYIRGSVKLGVGRFGKDKVEETFLIFDPLNIECEDVIFKTSNIPRVRNVGKVPAAPATPVTTKEVSKGPSGPGGTGLIRGTSRLGQVTSVPKTPKSTPSAAPSPAPTSTVISFVTGRDGVFLSSVDTDPSERTRLRRLSCHVHIYWEK